MNDIFVRLRINWFKNGLNLRAEIDLEASHFIKSPAESTSTQSNGLIYHGYSNGFNYYANHDDELKVNIHVLGGKTEGYLRLLCESELAHEFKWVKQHGDFETTNARIDKNVIHFQPFEIKDMDVYTCEAKNFKKSARKSVGINKELNFFKIYNTNNKSPKIIEIYKTGIEKIGHIFELDCVSGRLFYLYHIYSE